MLRLLTCCFFLSLHAISAQDGWQPLFNGFDLSNFEQLNGEAEYYIENEELVGVSKLGTSNSFMATKQHYADFILEFDVLVENGLNSGVQFRSLSVADYLDYRVHGYQCEIETSRRKWAGGIYDEARNAWLYPLSRNEKGRQAFVPGEWNHYRIQAIGPYIRTWVNGVQCAKLVDDTTAKGFIAFQVHAIKDASQEGKTVRWKNIKIKTAELDEEVMAADPEVPEVSYLSDLTPSEARRGWRMLWDGSSAAGWRGAKLDHFPERGWVMEDGILTVLSSGGGEAKYGGDIVTTDTYSNFELSIDFMITEGANSGIKYFVDPILNQGEGSAIGLEFQILDDQKHPDSKMGKNGNRTVGSLYDLIRAESLSSSRGKNFKGVGKWNNARILVDGSHVEHWLNHVKVVEYDRHSQVFKALVERSKYEKWADFGQQAAGHILIQDHGDEASFKNIKIREF